MTKLDKLNKVINILLESYNSLQHIMFIIKIKERKLISKNQKLRNINNRQCFIIGNGPSLKEVNLKLLAPYDIFTVNLFHKHDEKLINFSKYHIMIDEGFYTDEYINYVAEVYKKNLNTNFIFSTKGYNALHRQNLDIKRMYFIYQGLAQHENYLNIDMTKNMTASVNVVLAAIQCAIFMKYSTIYLLGCDFNSYATIKPTHFYKESANERTVPMGVDLQWSSMAHYHHYALARYAGKHGIRILNATPNSLIDAYERVDLADLI